MNSVILPMKVVKDSEFSLYATSHSETQKLQRFNHFSLKTFHLELFV